MGLRAEIEADLLETLEDPYDYGMPVILISPDGVIYNTSENDGETLYGRVLYDTIDEDEEGRQITVHQPNVTLRISSLGRVPENGEQWIVKIPDGPTNEATTLTCMLERALHDGSSLGIIKLHLRKTEQS